MTKKIADSVKWAYESKDNEAFTREELIDIKRYCLSQWQSYCIDGYMSDENPRAIVLEETGEYAYRLLRALCYRVHSNKG